MFQTRLISHACGALLATLLCAGPAAAATPTELMQGFASAAGTTPSAQRGQVFFTSKHGKEHSCSSCHTPTPTGMGKHVESGREIKPMAPAANAERFRDPEKV